MKVGLVTDNAVPRLRGYARGGAPRAGSCQFDLLKAGLAL